MSAAPEAPGAPFAAPSSATFDYAGPDDLRAPIAAALARVVDPELSLSIVDVGLVYGVAVADGRVHVLLTMTSAACPVADVIVDDIHAELDRALPDGWATDVELVWTPPWTRDRMSDRARRFMGW